MNSIESAREYVAAGLALLPVGKEKRPNAVALPKDGTTGRATWTPLQVTRATFAEVKSWLAIDPDTGLGVIAGAISGNLLVLDCDSEPFCAWLEREMTVALLERTWTVRTGSGKLHVYLRSKDPFPTQVWKTPDGEKLADIRGEGKADLGTRASYVVAPPSLHPSGVRYETLHGAPSAIARIGDPQRFLQKLLDRYLAGMNAVPITAVPVSVSSAGSRDADEDDDGRTGNAILPPLVGPEMQRIQRRIQAAPFHGNFVRPMIYEGMDGAPQSWRLEGKTNSDVDWDVLIELREAGFTTRECEQVFATFKVGEARYRNSTSRKSWGRSYFRLTLKNVDAQINAKRTASLTSVGANFTILGVARHLTDPPRFEFVFRNHATQGDDRAFVEWDELQTERGFQSSVGRQCPRLRPRLTGQYTGGGYGYFLDLVIQAAVLREVPEVATSQGYLRALLRTILSGHRIVTGVPAMPGDFRLGFRDEGRKEVYVRGDRLMAEITALMQRTPPKPEVVWFTLKNMGSRERRVRYGTGTERLWCVPFLALSQK